jgi:hypothetical protein
MHTARAQWKQLADVPHVLYPLIVAAKQPPVQFGELGMVTYLRLDMLSAPYATQSVFGFPLRSLRAHPRRRTC